MRRDTPRCPHSRNPRGFFRREPQRVPFQERDGAFGAKACEGRRRVGAADDDRARSAGENLDRVAHYLVNARIGRQRVIVVEDEHERSRQCGK
jgi:hypothetical protein